MLSSRRWVRSSSSWLVGSGMADLALRPESGAPGSLGRNAGISLRVKLGKLQRSVYPPPGRNTTKKSPCRCRPELLDRCDPNVCSPLPRGERGEGAGPSDGLVKPGT